VAAVVLVGLELEPGYLSRLAQPTQSPSALRARGRLLARLPLEEVAAIVCFQPSRRRAGAVVDQRQTMVLLAVVVAEVLAGQALLEQAAQATRPAQHQAKEAMAGQARMRAATEKVVAVAGRLL
jgi:hypothetical protein